MPDVSYVPGSMTAVIGDDCLALIDVPPDSPAVAWIWQKFRERALASTVLVGLLGSGFGGASSFVLIAEAGDGQPRVFCRGTASATVLGGEVSTRLDGAGMSTWSEHLIGPDAERVIAGEPPEAGALRLPASSGVLLAQCVIIDLAGAEAAAGDGAGSAAAVLVGAAATGGFIAVSGEPSIAETFRTIALDGRSALPAESERPAEPDHPAEPERSPAPVRPPRDDAPIVEDTVADAAASAPADENIPDTVTIPGSAESGPEPETPAAPPVPPAPRSGGRGASPSILIDAVPWAIADAGNAAGTGAASVVAEDPAEEEADGATVRRADLVAVDARVSLPPDRIGPVVAALVCAAGHANPPSSGACRRCGGSLPPDTVLVPRPVLGVLRTSLGDVITLDRGVVMGRNPAADLKGTNGEERPHVVKLPPAGGEISRTHLRITLDGWHVLLADLNSTNGTLVALPGRDPQQLPPGGQMPILPGTVVTLADGIDFRYEAAE